MHTKHKMFTYNLQDQHVDVDYQKPERLALGALKKFSLKKCLGKVFNKNTDFHSSSEQNY